MDIIQFNLKLKEIIQSKINQSSSFLYQYKFHQFKQYALQSLQQLQQIKNLNYTQTAIHPHIAIDFINKSKLQLEPPVYISNLMSGCVTFNRKCRNPILKFLPQQDISIDQQKKIISSKSIINIKAYFQQGSVLIYTMDGSIPSVFNGIRKFDSPIQEIFEENCIFRAIVGKNYFRVSDCLSYELNPYCETRMQQNQLERYQHEVQNSLLHNPQPQFRKFDSLTENSLES